MEDMRTLERDRSSRSNERSNEAEKYEAHLGGSGITAIVISTSRDGIDYIETPRCPPYGVKARSISQLGPVAEQTNCSSDQAVLK